MAVRRAATAIGAGVTTFLLVAVAVIELVDIEFSALVGLPVGVLAGIAVAAGLWISLADLGLGLRRAVSAYAAAGLTLLGLLALSYVNIGRGVLSVDVMVAVSVGVTVIVYLGLFIHDRQ